MNPPVVGPERIHNLKKPRRPLSDSHRPAHIDLRTSTCAPTRVQAAAPTRLQLVRMAPLMDTSALKHDGATATATALASILSAAATAVVAPLPFPALARADSETDDTDMDALNVLELPAVVLELVCAFVDHATLHAVEQTSSALFEVVQRSGTHYLQPLCTAVCTMRACIVLSGHALTTCWCLHTLSIAQTCGSRLARGMWSVSKRLSAGVRACRGRR